MGQEIERKYLLKGKPAGLTGGVEVCQGYLLTGDPEVRVRSKGNRYFVTLKSGSGVIRSEDEEEISHAAFDILWAATHGKRIEKQRYEIPAPDGSIWEVDEYRDHLEGLFTAEVELPSEEAEPVPPQVIAEVIIADISLRKEYKNQALAVVAGPPVWSGKAHHEGKNN